uniref:Uncharacterized protein n=1 Tax=Arundo donax TaxID=35708 RepID=A0A0A8ZWW9_ARUDO
MVVSSARAPIASARASCRQPTRQRNQGVDASCSSHLTKPQLSASLRHGSSLVVRWVGGVP